MNKMYLKGVLTLGNQETEIDDLVSDFSMETDLNNYRRIIHLEVVQRLDLAPNSKDLGEKKINKGENKMSVKIKKQPKEISIDELKKEEEFEKILIYIDEDKKQEIEEKYGINYKLLPVMEYDYAELEFKDSYMVIQSVNTHNIPYDIIEKIEIVK